jgi:hypothetical protein
MPIVADISMTAINRVPKSGNPTDYELAGDVADAVKEAAEVGGISRADIVRRFDGRGSRAKIYELIAHEIEQRGIVALAAPKKAQPIVPKGAPTILAEVKDIEEHAREVVQRAEHQPTDKPVDLVRELHASIHDCDLLMGLAKDGSGKIRNARLAAVSIDLKGRAVERLTRVRTAMDDEGQAAVYLRQVTDAILREPPDVKARILSRLRGINPGWGL